MKICQEERIFGTILSALTDDSGSAISEISPWTISVIKQKFR